MKKTFSFKSEKIAPERQREAINREIKKYIAREMRKTPPSGFDYWEFDCRFGFTEDAAAVIEFLDIRSCISRAFEEGQEGFYLEILAKPGHRPKRPSRKDEKVEDSE